MRSELPANDGVGGVKTQSTQTGNAVDVLMKNIPRDKQKEFLDIALELGIKRYWFILSNNRFCQFISFI